ncbi:hypothetical protein [Agromyces sp. NBRC 114283]|uniref:hypothetical protein n=1 Tax=Agromyces sp. NBRC 114283 TaxID=2994521 RepID=UPI0024A4B725|nr:hypothetical protein [Agromyces sp. NBRC 114283]GLU91334.1 hypothetical protein Agsp01_35890 [Agromyces sp. NBRC 114283]
MARYTAVQLDRLILLAEELGFDDDVAHWTKMRDALRGSEPDGFGSTPEGDTSG